MHARVAAEPGELALGIVARCLFERFDSFRKRTFSAQRRGDLLVADGLRGGGVLVFVPHQTLHFFDESCA